jgi:protein disulfide isomerase
MRSLAKVFCAASIFAVPYLVRAEDDEDLDEEDAPSDVLKMTSDNFEDVVSNTPYVLVKFFAPWCGHCKAMAPDYEAAAATLKKEEYSNVVLGEVDATVEAALAGKYDVQGYPTLYWFVNGNKREYQGPRSADGIVEWIKSNMGPTLKTMEAADAKAAVEARKPGEAIIMFEGDAKVEEVAGKIADEAVAAATYVYVKGSTSKLVLHRGTEETATYDGAYEHDALSTWIAKERNPMFGQITEDNFEIYMEHAKNGLFWVCFSPTSIQEDLKKFSPEFVKAAKAQSGDQYPFVWLDVAEFEAHAKEELGCSTFPTIVLQRGDLLGDREEAKVEKFLRSFSEKPEEMNAKAVETFFADIKSGALQPVEEPDELDLMDEDDEHEEGGDDADDKDLADDEEL